MATLRIDPSSDDYSDNSAIHKDMYADLKSIDHFKKRELEEPYLEEWRLNPEDCINRYLSAHSSDVSRRCVIEQRRAYYGKPGEAGRFDNQMKRKYVEWRVDSTK